MAFLLDTNVISETSRPRPSGAVVTWLVSAPASGLYLSVISLGEMRRGIELMRHRDAPRTLRIETWFHDVLDAFAGRVAPIDEAVADRWGRLSAKSELRPLAPADLLIAATALVHGWTVVTRNVRDFEPTGVPLLNPFDER